jgi:hypothetical protein
MAMTADDFPGVLVQHPSLRAQETNYARYLPEVDTGHDVIEAAIRESAQKVRSGILAKISEVFASEQEIKKPSKNRRLSNGAGEEGRTPDLMLGKHTL